MRTSSAKAKGRRLQQWVAEKISDLTGFQYGADRPIESRAMGQSGCDVRLERQVLDKFPFSVEAKNVEKVSLWASIDQAKANQIDGTDWLLIIKRNHRNPIVVMDGAAFFKLLGGMK